MSAQGLGCVKTFALFSNVEFLTQLSEFRHRELLWRLVGDGAIRRLFFSILEKSRFHTARVKTGASGRVGSSAHVRFTPEAGCMLA
jgi:hypothetical protein